MKTFIAPEGFAGNSLVCQSGMISRVKQKTGGVLYQTKIVLGGEGAPTAVLNGSRDTFFGYGIELHPNSCRDSFCSNAHLSIVLCPLFKPF